MTSLTLEYIQILVSFRILTFYFLWALFIQLSMQVLCKNVAVISRRCNKYYLNHPVFYLIVHIPLPYVHLLGTMSGSDITCHKNCPHLFNSYHDRKLNQNFLALQQLNNNPPLQPLKVVFIMPLHLTVSNLYIFDCQDTGTPRMHRTNLLMFLLVIGSLAWSLLLKHTGFFSAPIWLKLQSKTPCIKQYLITRCISRNVVWLSLFMKSHLQYWALNA